MPQYGETMAGISYKDLEGDLQKLIDEKPSKTFTISTAITTAFLLPILSAVLVMVLKEEFIDKPKENVVLVFDINQPIYHAHNEYITDIEVINEGRKGTGDGIVTLEFEFKGEILYMEWRQECEFIEEKGGVGELNYRVSWKNFDPGAKCAVLLKSTLDLVRVPVLKYNHRQFGPRIRNLLNARLLKQIE